MLPHKNFISLRKVTLMWKMTIYIYTVLFLTHIHMCFIPRSHRYVLNSKDGIVA